MSVIRPGCIHVYSSIEETSPPKVTWGLVDGAVGYVLEASVDGTFEENAAGFSWERIFNDGDPRSWHEIHGADCSWGTFHSLASGTDFEIYRGSGEETAPGPDTKGYTWYDIGKAEMDWYAFHRLGDDPANPGTGLSWRALGEMTASGRSWIALEGNRLSWDEIDGLLTGWDEMERLPPVTEAHITYPADGLPPEWNLFHKQKVTFRVKALGSGLEESVYLTSEEQRVLSRDTAEIAAKRGEEYLLQVDGSKVRDFRDADFWVTYDQSKLRFEGFVPEGVGGKSSQAAAAVTSNGKGSAGFRCEALIRTGLMWDGVVAKMRFTALTEGETEVELNRENTGGGRIV